jgi:hypothetical protein
MKAATIISKTIVFFISFLFFGLKQKHFSISCISAKYKPIRQISKKIIVNWTPPFPDRFLKPVPELKSAFATSLFLDSFLLLAP